MLRFFLIFVLAFPSGALAVTYTSQSASNVSSAGTWSPSGVPNEGDSVVLDHAVILDRPDLAVDSVTYNQGGGFTCTAGATLHILGWSADEASADDDFFVNEYIAADVGNGATIATAEDNWVDGIASVTAGQTVYFRKGTHYDAGSFDANGADIGSYGLGTIGYGQRPVFRLDATETMTSTDALPTTQTHGEIVCGDAVRATLIMDRTECAFNPCGMEFKLDIDQTLLGSTEPRLWRANYTDPYTEVRGGEDWLSCVNVWNFGDYNAGSWDKGVRAHTTKPWSKNKAMPLPKADHVYEHPGRYFVSVETTCGGTVIDNSVWVTVPSSEEVFDGDRTYCFADITGNGGGFKGCSHDNDNDGTCDVHTGNCVNTADFDVALNTTCNINTANRRCLFRRGDTFIASAEISPATSNVLLIGAFGADPEAARPIVDATSTGFIKLFDTEEVDNVVFMDLDVRRNQTHDGAVAFGNAGGSGAECTGNEADNVLHMRVRVQDTDSAFQYSDGEPAHKLGCTHSNLGFYEVEAVDGGFDGNTGNDFLVNADSGFVMGSRWGNRNSDEHGFRCATCSDFIFAHNNMGRLNDSDGMGVGGVRFLISMRDGFGAGQGSGGETEDDLAESYAQRFGMLDNYVFPGSNNANQFLVERTSNVSSSPNSAYEFWHTYAILGNLFSWQNRETGGRAINSIQASGLYGLVQSNIFLMDTEEHALGTSRALRFNDGKTSGSIQTANQFMWGIGNVFYSPTETSANLASNECTLLNEPDNCCTGPGTGSGCGGKVMVQISGSGSGDYEDVRLLNNLYWDDDSGAGTTVLSDSGERTVLCNGGATTCNQTETSNPFQSGLPSILDTDNWSPDLFKLSDAYVAANPGGNGVVPTQDWALKTDLYDNCRADSSPWEGVEEEGGVECHKLDGTATNNLNSTSPVGTNINRNYAHMPFVPFANAMKMAEEWNEDTSTCNFTNNGDYSGDIDDQGYPLDDVVGGCVWTRIHDDTHVSSQWELGEWVLDFDGTATVTVGGAASGLVNTAANRHTFTVGATTGGILIGFSSFVGLSNVRVFPPGGICADATSAPMYFEPWSFCDTSRCNAGDCQATTTCSGSHANCVDLEDAYNAGLLFHPAFVRTLQPFRALRLMDWARVNNVADWVGVETGNASAVAARWERSSTPVGMYSYNYNVRDLMPWGTNNTGNVPYAIQMELCRAVGAECWITIPHFATDAEIDRIGTLCRDHTDLTCYFQLSNEVWNFFDQTCDLWNAGNDAYGSCAENVCSGGFDSGVNCCRNSDCRGECTGADVGTPCTVNGDCPTSNDCDLVGAQNCSYSDGGCMRTWVGNRVDEMCTRLCNASTGIFGATGEEDRCNCVLGTQFTNTAVTTDLLECTCGSGGCGAGAPTCPWTDLDSLAVAPYFSGNSDCAIASQTEANLCDDSNAGDIDSMADYISSRIAVGGTNDFPQDQLDELTTQGLSGVALLAYEGGPSYTDKTSNGGVCMGVQDNVCVYDQYRAALDAWKAHTGEQMWMTFNNASNFRATDDVGNNGSIFGGRSDMTSVWTYGAGSGDTIWPKEEGYLDWSIENPCDWSGCNLRTPIEESTPSPPTRGGGGSGGSVWIYELEREQCLASLY